MNSLDQLLRDAMTEHTASVPHLRPGSARRALVTSRRRRGATMLAAGTATVAATAGVGAWALHLQPATSASGGPGAAHDGTATDPVATKRATFARSPLAVATRGAGSATPGNPSTPATGAPTAAAGSGAVSTGDYAGSSKSESDAPAELRAVHLTGPVDGLSVTPPSGVTPYYQLSESGKWSKWYWFAPTGRSEALGSAGAVVITEGVSRPSWNQRQSPSPAVSATTVNQRPGTVWLSGGDREIYYSAGPFTVEVSVGDGSVSLAQMKALGEAVQGLPQ